MPEHWIALLPGCMWLFHQYRLLRGFAVGGSGFTIQDLVDAVIYSG